MLVSLKYKSLQIYKIHLEEGSFRSLHCLVGSLKHLAGPKGGSMALFFHPPRRLHSLPGGILEAFIGSASQKDSGTGKEEPPKWRRPHHCHQGS